MHHLGKFSLRHPVFFIICHILSEEKQCKQVKTNYTDILSQHFDYLIMTFPLSRHEDMRVRSKEARPDSLK